MAIFDKTSRIFTEGPQVVSGRPGAARLTSMIADNERKIRQLYEEIGTWYCASCGENPDPAVADQVRGISQMQAQNEGWNDEIQRMNGRVKCPHCGTYVPDNVIFCASCGGRVLDENLVLCPTCGKPTDKSSLFCEKCGTRMVSSAPAQAAPPASTIRCRCGNVLQEKDAFCPICGTSRTDLEKEQAQQAAPPQTAPSRTCPVCGAALQEGDKFCQSCGSSLPASTPGPETPLAQAEVAPEPPAAPETPARTCPVCGAALQEGDKFCDSCGTPVPADAAPASPDPEQTGEYKRCPSCGAELTEGDKFCPDCGSPVTRPAQEPAEEPKAPEVSRCPNCGAELVEGDIFCAECGFSVSTGGSTQPKASKQNLCPVCGAEIEEGSKFCMECGTKVM